LFLKYNSYDINVGLPIFPYVGAGVGYQWVKLDRDISDSVSGNTIGGTEGGFAYDIIAGVAYPLQMVPGLSVTVEYRFTQLTQSRNFSGSFEGPPIGFAKLGQQTSHTFLLGLRYQLFQPADERLNVRSLSTVALNQSRCS
jgi:OOP family OmpA-OmpF porin